MDPRKNDNLKQSVILVKSPVKIAHSTQAILYNLQPASRNGHKNLILDYIYL